MKVTVVATVLNNGDTVSQLIDSILNQSKKADEIIVVDGGSKDNTVSVLQKYQEGHKNLKIISDNLNKAESRNVGIEEAKYKIIAQIDGSCVADRDWLENLLLPMEDREVGVSAGFYDIVAETPIAKAVAPFIGITPKRLDPRAYMPTGRSMAIRKSVWRDLHGYSEDLQWSGEDNLFNYKLLKKKIKIARVPNAFVYWYAPKTLRDAYRKIFSYTAGIAQTGTWSHPCESLATVRANIFATYFRYGLGGVLFAFSLLNLFFLFILILGFTLYVFYSMWAKREEINSQEALMMVPVVQVVSDIAVMAGFISGLVSPSKRKHKKARS